MVAERAGRRAGPCRGEVALARAPAVVIGVPARVAGSAARAR